MPTHAVKLITLALAVGVVAPAGLAIAHSYSETRAHECKGQAQWDNRSGITRQDVALAVPSATDKVYVSLYLETGAVNPDAARSVWMESNGWSWLQKEDFTCAPSLTGEYVPHPDTRLL